MASVVDGGAGLNRFFVQGWYNLYQVCMMTIVMLFIWLPTRKQTTPFVWRWSILFISLFLTAADMAYFYALSCPGAMIAIVSMVRRGSVIVSFLFGAMIFKEKNLRSKAIDLLFVLLGMACLFIWKQVSKIINNRAVDIEKPCGNELNYKSLSHGFCFLKKRISQPISRVLYLRIFLRCVVPVIYPRPPSPTCSIVLPSNVL